MQERPSRILFTSVFDMLISSQHSPSIFWKFVKGKGLLRGQPFPKQIKEPRHIIQTVSGLGWIEQDLVTIHPRQLAEGLSLSIR